MKLKNLFITLGLSLALGIGVGASLSAKKEVKVTKAETNSVTLAGSFNDWNTTAEPLTLNGDYWTIDKTLAVDDEFKIVVNGSDWVGRGTGVTDPEGCFSGTDGSNFKCVIAGDYTIKAVKTIGDYGDKKYGIVIEQYVEPVPPTYVDTTLQATFSSDVPEYVDIFVPGTFNSWKTSDTTAKMTRVNARTFTYALDDVVVGSHKYKLAAEYVGASGVSWAHEIDGSDQNLTIQESDDGNTVALGSARNYDFATNMPQKKAHADAVVQLTFANAVPTTVDIIFVGSLTSWGTTAANKDAGKMTPNAGRTVFTWELPENTYIGDYQYKIVAMSKYTKATAVAYDDLVYGELATNEVLHVDEATETYSLNALATDLSNLAIFAFAEGFIDAMDDICGTTEEEWNVNHAGSALNTAWATWKGNFESLSEGVQGKLGTSEDATVVRAKTLYLHCVARYSLTAWTGAPAASAVATISTAQANNSAILLAVIISATALVAVGGYFLLRKKKEN